MRPRVVRRQGWLLLGLAVSLLGCEGPDDVEAMDGGDGGGLPAVDGSVPDRRPYDAGVFEEGSPDSGLPDTGQIDGGLPDGEHTDGGLPDGEHTDGGLPDGERADGGLPDGERADGGLPDAGRPDGGASPRCVGKPGARRGKVLASVTVGAAKRTFIVYAPAVLDPNTPVPLILSPHGYKMAAEEMFTLTGFKEVADREGLVAVFPDGNDGAPWNVGAGISGVGFLVNNLAADDQSFVDAILAYVQEDQCLDTKHVFASGFSMGGYFSNELGCLRSDVAGIGPHSGGSHELSACPGPIKPVILFHGDADPLITYDNGTLARDRWAARNGCSTSVEVRPVTGGSCDYNRDCPPHAQVALCHFDGMGHVWAGGTGTKNADSSRESASELAWKFWKTYAW